MWKMEHVLADVWLAATEQRPADTLPHIIESVLGHKRQRMTLGTYSGGAAIKQMKKCVEAVSRRNRGRDHHAAGDIKLMSRSRMTS